MLTRLLDISGMFYPLWHVFASKGDSPGDATARIVTTLREHAARGGADYVVACCDSLRCFRHEIAEEYKALAPEYKGYKGHRPAKDAAMMAALDRVIGELEQDGIPIMRADGYEADDVIATVTKWATSEGHDVEIVSEDKDLLQLVQEPDPNDPEDNTPRVVVVRRNETRQDFAACVDRMGVPPVLVPQMLALMGDESDGVIGIHGIGKKTAAELLWGKHVNGKWERTRYRNFDAIVGAAIDEQIEVEKTLCRRVHKAVKKNVADERIAEVLKISIDEVAAFKKRQPEDGEDIKPQFASDVRKSLIANSTAYDIGLRLTTLCNDVPLDFAQVTAPRVPKPRAEKTFFDPTITAAFETENDMTTTIETMGETQAEHVTQNDPQSEPTPVVAAKPTIEMVPPKPTKPDTSLAVVQTQAMAATGPSREFERQLEPANFVQALKLAEAIASSRKLKDMHDKNEVLLQMVMGRSIGLNLFQSLCLFYIVEGKGAMAAQLVAARVRQHPMCEFFRKRSGDKTHATWESKAKGDSRVMTWTFTTQDAKDARLGGSDKSPNGQFDPKSNWAKYPAQMCSWRAVMFLAREEWPEITAGIYDPDEIREQAEAPSLEDMP